MHHHPAGGVRPMRRLLGFFSSLLGPPLGGKKPARSVTKVMRALEQHKLLLPVFFKPGQREDL